MKYEHNRLYVYDATSQTFDEHTGRVHELDLAFRKCLAEGYTTFVSSCGSRVSVSLHKYAHSGTPGLTMEVRAEAPTVAEAFEKAFANFPKNPLDGATRWADNRIAAPVEDGEFTETKS